MSGRTFLKWWLGITVVLTVLIVGCVVAVVVSIDGDDTSSGISTGSRWTHHNCIKVQNRSLYNGKNLRTGRVEQPVNPDKCTDITWEDGERIFNITPSQIERLIQYR